VRVLFAGSDIKAAVAHSDPRHGESRGKRTELPMFSEVSGYDVVPAAA
jgi:hypothetical protein